MWVLVPWMDWLRARMRWYLARAWYGDRGVWERFSRYDHGEYSGPCAGEY